MTPHETSAPEADRHRTLFLNEGYLWSSFKKRVSLLGQTLGAQE